MSPCFPFFGCALKLTISIKFIDCIFNLMKVSQVIHSVTRDTSYIFNQPAQLFKNAHAMKKEKFSENISWNASAFGVYRTMTMYSYVQLVKLNERKYFTPTPPATLACTIMPATFLHVAQKFAVCVVQSITHLCPFKISPLFKLIFNLPLS